MSTLRDFICILDEGQWQPDSQLYISLYFKKGDKQQQIVMSDTEFTDANSTPIDLKIQLTTREQFQKIKNKNIEIQQRSKKKYRKSMAPKISPQLKQVKQENMEFNYKQSKLTQYFTTSNSIKKEIDKNLSDTDILKKTIEEQLEHINQQITTLKKQKQGFQQKYTILEKENQVFTYNSKQMIKKILLQTTQAKRKQRSIIIPNYGYFKDGNHKNFIMGQFLNQMHKNIQQKMKRMDQVRIQIQESSTKDKEMLIFVQKFYQKELEQMKEQLKRREKIVASYRQKIAFAHIQSESHYAIMGWPAIGEKQRFQTLELLGCGGFGSVYKCFDLLSNTFVALKQNRFSSAVGLKNEDQKQNYLKHMNRQVKIQKNLNHPNIAKLIEILQMDENQVSFIMEYLEGPELGKYLKQNQCLPESEAKPIIRQLICALKYLYQQDNKVIHYDLKPSNIMFHQGVVKIVDFGLCKQMENDDTRIGLTSYGVGTYYYLPPETFLQEKSEVSPKVDIWSAGIIFYELLYGRKPFGHGITQAKIYSNGIILNAKKVQFPIQTPLKYKVSDAAKNFIKDCLKYKQQERLSPLEAYQHQYLK